LFVDPGQWQQMTNYLNNQTQQGMQGAYNQIYGTQGNGQQSGQQGGLMGFLQSLLGGGQQQGGNQNGATRTLASATQPNYSSGLGLPSAIGSYGGPAAQTPWGQTAQSNNFGLSPMIQNLLPLIATIAGKGSPMGTAAASGLANMFQSNNQLAYNDWAYKQQMMGTAAQQQLVQAEQGILPTLYGGLQNQVGQGFGNLAQGQQAAFDPYYQNAMQGYNDVTQGTQGLLQNAGQQQARDIQQNYGNLNAQNQGNLAGRGLSNATTGANMATANQRSMNDALSLSNQGYDQLRAGMLAQTGGQAANASQQMLGQNYGDQMSNMQNYLTTTLGLSGQQVQDYMNTLAQYGNVLGGNQFQVGPDTGLANTMQIAGQYGTDKAQQAQTRAMQQAANNPFASIMGGASNIAGLGFGAASPYLWSNAMGYGANGAASLGLG
jgi:hypothetical protein